MIDGLLHINNGIFYLIERIEGGSRMGNVIYTSQTVYEIVKEHPEVMEIMKEIGFTDITKPGMLQTAGRFMTLAKGSQIKNISMDKMKEAFKSRGYELQD
jgi:hypothetical protein